MKYLIFDAGPIISLTMNGLLPILKSLKEDFNGKFIITPSVKKEVIDKPLRIKKFKLEAMQVKKLLEDGVLSPSSEIISNQALHKETAKILKQVNNSLKSTRTNQRIKIVHEGEASCLALSNLCECENLIVIDERTTRVLEEAPEKLRELIERKLRTPIEQMADPLPNSKADKFIRSSELIYIAYKKGLLQEKTKDFLDAALFALKFKGTAISSKEIEEIKKLA
jgi:predicted nucleic acid-binding protein